MNDEPDPLRELLRAARPSGQDDADPDVRAARAAVAADEELQAALTRECDDDAAIARALRSAPVPDDLEARLLTAIRAARAQIMPPPGLEAQVIEAVRSTRSREIPAPSETPHWSRREWFAATAAAAAVCAGGALWWQRQQRLPMAQLTAQLIGFARAGVTLSLMSMDKTAVAAWLDSAQAPRSAHLYPRLDALGRKGCHVYDVEGHPVSLECLIFANMRVLHCFTTRTPGLRDAPAATLPPSIRTQDGFTVATWTRDDQTIVIVSEESPELIQSLLG